MKRVENKNSRVLVKRLAGLLAESKGSEILTTIQLLRQPFLQAESALPPSGPPAQIGVWKLNAASGEYRRAESEKAHWSFWAERESFTLQKTKQRVILFGESAARAWFYDPQTTLAGLIGEYLGPEYEVIDLARTDMNAFEVGQLAVQAAALEPDAVVLFAGNNWLNFREYTAADTEAVIDGLDRGLAAGREVFEQRVLPRATERVLAQLAQSPGRKIVVIPEFNLGNWRPFIETALPIGNYAEIPALLEALPKLASLYRDEKWDALSSLCDAIEAQTGKASALPFYFRGRALQRQGKSTEALAQLELAKDAPVGIEMPSTPRCPTVVQQTLRTRGAELGMAVVDLPALFRGADNGTVPGEAFFLDYCHLTLRGLHTLARAAATQVAGEELADRFDPQQDLGVAYFLAALHGAHYGQDKALLARQLAKSVELDPTLRETLAAYLEFQSSATPRWLHRAYAGATENAMVARYFNRSQPGGFDKFADYQIFDAIAEVLGTAEASAQAVSQSLGHAAGSSADLLDPRFSSETVVQYWMDHTASFFQAHARESTFFLPLAEAVDWELSWNARLPPRNDLHGSPQLQIAVNGQPVAEGVLSTSWSTGGCRLEAKYLVAGVNKITVRWPASFPRWEDFAREYRRCLQVVDWPHTLPTFGELFALEARPAR